MRLRSKTLRSLSGDLFQAEGVSATAHESPPTDGSVKRAEPAQLSPEQRSVAVAIEAHRRTDPIPLRSLVARVGLSERVVQQIIEELIVTHGVRIGASRELPRAGYYLCVDAADIDAAVRPLRSSAASLLKRIEALTRSSER
jgi:hypothetical protein